MGKMQYYHNKQLKTLARLDESLPTVILFYFPLKFITKSFTKEKRMLIKYLRKYIQTKTKSIEKQACSVPYELLNVGKTYCRTFTNRWRSTKHITVYFQGQNKFYFIGSIYF